MLFPYYVNYARLSPPTQLYEAIFHALTVKVGIPVVEKATKHRELITTQYYFVNFANELGS